MENKPKNLTELKAELVAKDIGAKGNKKRSIELATAAGVELKKKLRKYCLVG